MADFKTAEPYILLNEGGYARVPGDSGGETYEGISRNDFPHWQGWNVIDAHQPLDHGEIIPDPSLAADVDSFYQENFWNGIKGDEIENQAVATYLYDFYVNAMHNTTKCLQRVLGITADGAFGSGTLSAVNNYNGDLLLDLHTARKNYYLSIAVGHNAQFLSGWVNRANNLYAKLRA